MLKLILVLEAVSATGSGNRSGRIVVVALVRRVAALTTILKGFFSDDALLCVRLDLQTMTVMLFQRLSLLAHNRPDVESVKFYACDTYHYHYHCH